MPYGYRKRCVLFIPLHVLEYSFVSAELLRQASVAESKSIKQVLDLLEVPPCGCARCRGLSLSRPFVDETQDTQCSWLVPMQAALPGEQDWMDETSAELHECLACFQAFSLASSLAQHRVLYRFLIVCVCLFACLAACLAQNPQQPGLSYEANMSCARNQK